MEYMKIIMLGMGILFLVVGIITRNDTLFVSSNVWVVGSFVYGS